VTAGARTAESASFDSSTARLRTRLSALRLALDHFIRQRSG
jgi:hypothetical protein